MEDVMIVLIALLCAAVIALIAVYSYLDRRRFYMDRLIQSARPALDRWARACGALSPGADGPYFQARRNWERTACLRRLVEEVPGSSPEKLEAQEDLLEFCHRYNKLAQRYDQTVQSPLLAPAARLFRFRPYGQLDFYPDVRLQKDR